MRQYSLSTRPCNCGLTSIYELSPQVASKAFLCTCRQRGCIRISGLFWALTPWPFCNSRSGGQAFNRSRGSALLSDLFRCRTHLLRQCCCSPQPQENHCTFTDYHRRQAGFTLCQLPLKRRSWHHTAQQIRTSLLASATAALLCPMRAAVSTAQRCNWVSFSGVRD